MANILDMQINQFSISTSVIIKWVARKHHEDRMNMDYCRAFTLLNC